MNIGMILAGGSGERMGNMKVPKQFADIYGKPIIIHTLETFNIHQDIDEIVVICKKEYIEDLKIHIRKFEIDKVKKIVEGGETRQKSIYNGLLYLENKVKGNDVLVIHDSVRPLISSRIINDNIRMAKEFGAVDTVVPASDTIVKSIKGKYMDEVPNRSELYMGQTPQSFTYDVIRAAHDNTKNINLENATDDCQLVIKNKHKVALVEGDKINFKITTQEDLLLLKAVVKMSKLERI